MTDSYAIDVRVEESFAALTPTVRLREALAATLRQHRAAEGVGLTLLITDDETVRQLNRRFRGVDAPTDVLSFPAGDDDLPTFDQEPYLGDILIACPYTAAQAAAAGHALEDELVLLAVHGALHLLGFDHDTPQRQAAMWAAQEALLRQLGVPAGVVPPHDFASEE